MEFRQAMIRLEEIMNKNIWQYIMTTRLSDLL